MPYTIGEPFDIGVLNTAKPSRATSTRDVVLEKAITQAAAAPESQVIRFFFDPENDKVETVKAAAACVMAFSRTTSRVEVAREGLAVFRTPMSKGSPMVYGLGFLLGGTSQHLLRVWFLQGQDTSLNERWKGSRCPEQQSPCRERGAASGRSGTSARRRAFEGVWAAVGAVVRTPATIPLQIATPSRSGRSSFRRGRDEPVADWPAKTATLARRRRRGWDVPWSGWPAG